MYKPIVQAVIGITIALGASGCAQYTSQPSGLRATPSATRGGRMSTEANKRMMERFTGEFLPTGDATLAEQFISPDIVMHFAGRQQRGRDAYLAIVAANRVAFPDLVWTVDQMVADGDTVAIRYTMTGTHRGSFAGIAPTNRRVVAHSMAFYRLADGKIVEERAQLDMLGLLQQFGAVPGEVRP
jgi:steroid delta-isomerase-like uncharacterized protein